MWDEAEPIVRRYMRRHKLDDGFLGLAWERLVKYEASRGEAEFEAFVWVNCRAVRNRLLVDAYRAKRDIRRTVYAPENETLEWAMAHACEPEVESRLESKASLEAMAQRLTGSQLAMLERLAAGKTSADIAREKGVSRQAVSASMRLIRQGKATRACRHCGIEFELTASRQLSCPKCMVIPKTKVARSCECCGASLSGRKMSYCSSTCKAKHYWQTKRHYWEGK